MNCKFPKKKGMSYRAIVLLFFEKIIVLSIAFENHRKSLIQQRVHIQKKIQILFLKNRSLRLNSVTTYQTGQFWLEKPN